MHFCHAAEIWADFPRLVPGLLAVEGVASGASVEEPLERWYERARARLSQSSEGEMPEVAAWRRVYSQMGLKPTQYRSAAEALLRRFRREGALPRLHPLVDLCNAASLAFALPVAVFDLDQVEGFLEVRRAHGRERYLAFSGQEELPEPGEVIFADAAENVHARRWTFRQSRLSTVSEATRRVLIVSEGHHQEAPRDVPRLLEELAAQIAALWQQPGKRAVLTAASPRLSL